MKNKDITYQVWNREECAEIMEAVYAVLENTGCEVQHEGARTLMAKAGCRVDESRVHIPASLMKWAIESAPKEVTLFDRSGDAAMELKPGNSFFGPPITTVFVKDMKTGEKRRGTRADAANAAIVCDALPNIDWVCAMSGISDGNVHLPDLYEVYEMLLYTKKPVMYWATDLQNLSYEFEMFEAVAGSAAAFRQKPFAIALVCPMDPLKHTEEGVSQVIYLAEKKAPVVYIAGVGFGSSSPITLAGNVVVGLADTLVGLLISQLTNAGTPFVLSKFSDNIDMGTVMVNHSRPEMLLANAASADVFTYLGLPFCLNFGDTDNGVFNQKAAFDLGVHLYTALLSGSCMNMSIGGFESGNLSDLEGLIYGDEVIDFLKQLVTGIPIDKETLALDSIGRVGPGGNYMLEESTFKFCRDFWQPALMKSASFRQWQDGGKKELSEALHQKVLDILEQGTTHALPRPVAENLGRILQKAEKAYAEA